MIKRAATEDKAEQEPGNGRNQARALAVTLVRTAKGAEWRELRSPGGGMGSWRLAVGSPIERTGHAAALSRRQCNEEGHEKHVRMLSAMGWSSKHAAILLATRRQGRVTNSSSW